MLDESSGFNQVLVIGEDKNKNTFVKPQKTFSYANTTFKSVMDHAFNDIIGK